MRFDFGCSPGLISRITQSAGNEVIVTSDQQRKPETVRKNNKLFKTFMKHSGEKNHHTDSVDRDIF
jgi:acyl-CoA thioesterase